LNVPGQAVPGPAVPENQDAEQASDEDEPPAITADQRRTLNCSIRGRRSAFGVRRSPMGVEGRGAGIATHGPI
jgi:hypothetical protein